VTRWYEFTCPVGHKHRSERSAKDCCYCKWKGVPTNKPGDAAIHKRIRHKHKVEIVPVTNNIRRDWDAHQGKLFEEDKGVEVKSRAGTKMGNFYESVTACLFGGRIAKNPHEIGAKAKGNSREVVPDVICDERQHIIESKGCNQRSHLNLYDTQVDGYLVASKIKGYKVRFAIWRHGFQGVHKYRGPLIDLYAGIANATYAGLVLPLRLVIMLRDNKTFNHYNHATAGSLTSVRSKFINDLIIEPEIELNKIGIDYREFEFERLLSPKDLMVENVQLPQFPVLVVSNVVSDPWTEGGIPF
jgi:hypothetical protein